MVLNKKNYDGMFVYVNKMRPLLKNLDNLETLPKNFFLAFSGKAIFSDNVNKAIKQIWKEAGGKGDLGGTLIRAQTTTAIHKYRTALDKDLLARLLCHKTTTAEKFYKQVTRSEDTVRAINLVVALLIRIKMKHQYYPNLGL